MDKKVEVQHVNIKLTSELVNLMLTAAIEQDRSLTSIINEVLNLKGVGKSRKLNKTILDSGRLLQGDTSLPIRIMNEDYDKLQEEATEAGLKVCDLISDKLCDFYGVEHAKRTRKYHRNDGTPKPQPEHHDSYELKLSKNSNKCWATIKFINTDDIFELDGDAYERHLTLNNHIKIKLGIADYGKIRRNRTNFCKVLNNDNTTDHYVQLVLSDVEYEKLMNKITITGMNLAELINACFSKKLVEIK